MTYAILLAIGMGAGFAIAAFAAVMLRARMFGVSRETEEAYRRCEASFAFTTVGCAHLDPKGRWLRVNDALCDLTGYDRDELLTKSIQDLTHPDDLAAGNPELTAIFSGAVDEVAFEKRYVRKEGTVRWANVMETLIRDRRGRPEFIVAFLFDITARKEAEAALHESEERLRQLQSEFAYLTRASDLGEMAAGIAHEINQPLAAIVNFLSIGLLVAEQGYSEEGFAEAEEMMNLASAQALRAGETVRRIREFIGDGNGTRTIERVDGLVDAAMALALIDARSTGIEVRRIDGAGDAEVRVDAVQIQQILVNLLRNAMDELEDLPPGSERWLELSTQTHVGGVVEIEITDSGGGVPADIKEHIFDPFVTSKTGRMGMGLPICRRLAETHGGKIETESAPGRGATFKLVLPRFRPAAG